MVADIAALRMTSELHRVMERAAQLEQAGRRMLHLERGEPDFATPGHIVDALVEAARAGETHYPDARGGAELREALAHKVGSENRIPCHPSQVVVTVGGTHALFLAFQALLGDGDELLVLSPHWMAVPKMVALTRTGRHRALQVYLDLQKGALSPEGLSRRIREALSEETRGLYVNTPNNPTGAVVPRAHLEAVARLCVERDLWVVSDEAYEHLVFGDERHVSIASLPGMAERTVSVFTFSKSYAMTGWRLGYLVAPPLSAQVLGALLSFHTTHGVFPAVQTAGVAALRGPQDAVESMRAAYQERREGLLEELKETPGISVPSPQGSFYVFADVSGVMDGADIWSLVEEWLELGVAVLPGTAFGSEFDHHVRISLATRREDLTAAARILARRYATERARSEG